MQRFVGKWELEKSQGFSGLLKQLGVEQKFVEIADNVKNTIEISELQEGQYKFHCENSVQNSDDVFCLGKEFQESSPDGRILTSKITLDNDTMRHEQIREGQKILILRTIENGKMKTIAQFGDCVCERWYKKLQ
nr:fatty acid binding protein a [Hymenolepis microstoma]